MPTPALTTAEAQLSNVPYPHARVSLAELEAQIEEVHFVTGAAMVSNSPTRHKSLDTLTVCTLILRNGWIVIGHSAPVDSRNYSTKLGEQIAYENAVRQVWPLLGFLRKQAIHDAVLQATPQP